LPEYKIHFIISVLVFISYLYQIFEFFEGTYFDLILQHSIDHNFEQNSRHFISKAPDSVQIIGQYYRNLADEL